MFKTCVWFVVLILVTYYAQVRGDDNCDTLGVLLYEEIGCKPVKDQPDHLCPSSYDCSHLHQEGDHCYFQGKKYKNREALPDNATYGTCNGGCFCDAGHGRSSGLRCASFDCPEFLGGSRLDSPQCIRTYELESCCSKGQICPPFDNIATCEVDGVTYKEGQQFYPKTSCNACICQKGFVGKYEKPLCKRQNCGVEIRHSQDIRDNCAPVYENNNARCCPRLWICPTESDIFSPSEKNNASAKLCKFGEKEIKSGQILQRSVEQYGTKYDLKCDCQVPPLLTCIIVHSEYIKN